MTAAPPRCLRSSVNAPSPWQPSRRSGGTSNTNCWKLSGLMAGLHKRGRNRKFTAKRQEGSWANLTKTSHTNYTHTHAHYGKWWQLYEFTQPNLCDNHVTECAECITCQYSKSVQQANNTNGLWTIFFSFLNSVKNKTTKNKQTKNRDYYSTNCKDWITPNCIIFFRWLVYAVFHTATFIKQNTVYQHKKTVVHISHTYTHQPQQPLDSTVSISIPDHCVTYLVLTRRTRSTGSMSVKELSHPMYSTTANSPFSMRILACHHPNTSSSLALDNTCQDTHNNLFYWPYKDYKGIGVQCITTNNSTLQVLASPPPP